MEYLNELFKRQQNLDRVVGNDPRYPTTMEKKIQSISTAIIHESVELQRLCDIKWWKQYKGFDIDAAIDELIDIQHFVTSGALVLNLTPETFFNAYVKKNDENFKRQQTGYNGNIGISNMKNKNLST